MYYVVLGAIKFYQRFLSPFLPKACRYYPSCSEYAIWVVHHQPLFLAIWNIILRILRCNHFFTGGIDYPIVYADPKPNIFIPCKIAFWFIPLQNHRKKFFVIKSITQGK